MLYALAFEEAAKDQRADAAAATLEIPAHAAFRQHLEIDQPLLAITSLLAAVNG
jgi:hypothetical protein